MMVRETNMVPVSPEFPTVPCTVSYSSGTVLRIPPARGSYGSASLVVVLPDGKTWKGRMVNDAHQRPVPNPDKGPALWALSHPLSRHDPSPTEPVDVDMRAETEKRTTWCQNIRFLQQIRITVFTAQWSELMHCMCLPFGKKPLTLSALATTSWFVSAMCYQEALWSKTWV